MSQLNSNSDITLAPPDSHYGVRFDDLMLDEPDEDVEFKPDSRFWLALAPLVVLAMMVSLDSTSVSVALPIMAQKLNGTTIQAFWTGTSFLLSSAVLQAPIAALSGIVGRMPMILGCTVLFLIGIILSAVANDFTLLFVGRSIQGVGGGGIILLNDIIIADLVPMRQRGKYFGIIGGIWALGSVIGPVIGGLLADKASWRWIFWINVPFAVIGLVFIPLCLRLSRPPGSVKQKLKRFDWFGSIFFVAATTCFLIPLTWGGVQYEWSDWRTAFPLVLGVIAILAFCLFERFLVAEPVMKLDLLGNYEMIYSLLATMVNSLIIYGALYFLPLYFEAVQGFKPVIAGVALFPATFTVAPMSALAGVIISKRGEYRSVTWIGWTISTLGLGVMILLDVGTTNVQWFFLTFTTGIGLGMLYISLGIINQAAVEEEHIIFAISMFIFFRMLGQCLGVALSGVIFQNQMRSNLLGTTTLAQEAYEYSRDASSLVSLIKEMPDGLQKKELIQAYASSLKIVWAVMCGLSGAAMVGSFFIKQISLDREHKTEQGIDETKSKRLLMSKHGE